MNSPAWSTANLTLAGVARTEAIDYEQQMIESICPPQILSSHHPSLPMSGRSPFQFPNRAECRMRDLSSHISSRKSSRLPFLRSTETFARFRLDRYLSSPSLPASGHPCLPSSVKDASHQTSQISTPANQLVDSLPERDLRGYATFDRLALHEQYSIKLNPPALWFWQLDRPVAWSVPDAAP
jgi:hypothetical protein